MRTLIPVHRLTVMTAFVVLLGCDSSTDLQDNTPPVFNSVHALTARDELLRSVRQATARFNSTTQAAAAGYQEPALCVPQMGFHWSNLSLIDPVFDPVQPEVLIYAPGPGGTPRLVAVEYVVIDTGQPRPSFGGHPFDIRGTPIPAPHWSLHVWLYADNPDGIFPARNPKINCP